MHMNFIHLSDPLWRFSDKYFILIMLMRIMDNNWNVDIACCYLRISFRAHNFNLTYPSIGFRFLNLDSTWDSGKKIVVDVVQV